MQSEWLIRPLSFGSRAMDNSIYLFEGVESRSLDAEGRVESFIPRSPLWGIDRTLRGKLKMHKYQFLGRALLLVSWWRWSRINRCGGLVDGIDGFRGSTEASKSLSPSSETESRAEGNVKLLSS